MGLVPSTQGWEGWRQLRPDRALPKYRVLLVLTQETTDFQSQRSHGVGSRKILRMGHGVKVEGNDTKTGEILSTFDIHSALFGVKVTLLVWESDSIRRLYRRLSERFRPGFLPLNTSDTLDQAILCWGRACGCLEHCRTLNSTPGCYPSDASGTSTASAVRTKMFPDTNIP